MPDRETPLVIACPKCNWQPEGGEQWQCSCGHIWDTFETAGECPACYKQWQDTWCLTCHCPSEHAAWYRQDKGLPLFVILPN
jgi:hypothetical protein